MVNRARVILLIALSGLAAHAAEVTASLSPESVPAGEGATLAIRIEGGRAQPPQLPAVPDLIFNGPQTSHVRSLFNGTLSQNVTYTYAVGSMKPGDYTIPALTLQVDGVAFQTRAFKLRVTPSAKQLPQGFQGQTPPAAEAAPAGASEGFLTVELVIGGREQVWVGEIAPVRIKAWLPEQVPARLTSNLQPESTAFTLHNLSPNPQQGAEMRGGRRWSVVTWFAGLSAAKAGTYLPDLTVKAALSLPDPNALTNRRGMFFAPPTIQKEVVLSSKQGEGKSINVRPLPREGRPENFSGAVGKFALQGANLPQQWQTGEPQQLSIVVAGEGNFTLLAQPELHPAEVWKSYEGKHEFAAMDNASFSGRQTWQFSVMPRKAGAQPLSLAFSYFDPAAARYETVTSPPQTVQVSGADLPAEVAPAGSASAPKKPDADLLAPLRTEDSGVRSLTPVALRPVFIASGGAALAGLLIGWLRTRQRNDARALREAVEQATRSAVSEAEASAARGDVSGFFAAARRALQTKLGAHWSRPAQAITLADVAARVPDDSPVTQIFREADRVEYGRAASSDLAAWRSTLHHAMNSLPA